MHSTNVSSRHQERGSLKIWTILLIAAMGCVIAVVVLQVMEYLFYDQPRSVWPGAGPSAAPSLIVEPLAERVTKTDVTPEEVPTGLADDDKDAADKEEEAPESTPASVTEEAEKEPKTELVPADDSGATD
ncbi:hypothetical protein ACFLQR_03675 [Verrucomicrobiota bacterium]